MHYNIDQFIALLPLFCGHVVLENERGKMYFARPFNLRTCRRIELITVHAQSKRVAEFHFSLKCPSISVLVLEKSLNFL